jgi:hypothetical protein
VIGRKTFIVLEKGKAGGRVSKLKGLRPESDRSRIESSGHLHERDACARIAARFRRPEREVCPPFVLA